MLCVVESASKTLLTLLRAVRTDSTKLCKWVRVCALSEEVPREFRVFAVRAHRGADEDDFTAPNANDWLRFVFGTLRCLLELGREVASMADEKSQENFLASNKSAQVMTRIPSLARVRSFGSCPDMCSVDEYLETFDTPVDFTLESEKVWPVESPLRF